MLKFQTTTDEQLIALGGMREVSEWVRSRPISTDDAFARLRELEVNPHDLTADEVRVAAARLRFQADAFAKAADAILSGNPIGLGGETEIVRAVVSLVEDTEELTFLVRDARIAADMVNENHTIVGALKEAAAKCRDVANQLDADRLRLFGKRYQARIANLQTRKRSAA